MYNKKAGKLQTGITFPKQYWLAVNGKPKIIYDIQFKSNRIQNTFCGYIPSKSPKNIDKH